MKIGNHLIGDNSKPFVIAEVGINHNGDKNLAKRMILSAKESGADAVKIQSFKVESFCLKKSKYYSLFQSCQLDEFELAELYDYSNKIGIIFFSSVFDEWSVNINYKLNTQCYKIASGDINNFPLLSAVAKKSLPIIISTGASNIEEVSDAIDVIYCINKKIKVAILHCISNYPTDFKDVHLRYLQELRRSFDIPIGFSDHTVGNDVAMAAVANGANLIEKHFTIDNSLEGPDHKHSCNPTDFKNLTSSILNIFKARGSIKKPLVEGEETIKQIRRGVYAARDIEVGETITHNMLKICRPESELKPKDITNIIGKKVKNKIKFEEGISLDDL